jgi:hypothetical protein
MRNIVTGVHCERGRSYVGQTGRADKQTASHVAVREHGRHVQEGLSGKFEVAEHAYGEGQWIYWNEVRILRIEINSRYNWYIWRV